MSDIKRLLQDRAERKRRKPSFIMQDAHKKPKLAQKWRMPRGIDSKIRLGLNGYRKKPTQGYRSPKAVRGWSKRGLTQNLVATVVAIDALDPKTDGVILSGTISKLKKYELAKHCQNKGFTIINLADIAAHIKAFDEVQLKKKTAKEQKAKEKEKKKEDLKKKADKKEAEDAQQQVAGTTGKKEDLKGEEKEKKQDAAPKDATDKAPGKEGAPAVKKEDVPDKQDKKEIDKILTKKGSE